LIIRFPPRRIGAVIVCRERNGDGWLTLAGPHGWLHGDLDAARAEARWLARNLGLPIREMRLCKEMEVTCLRKKC
jgi:hypothetical protein